MLQFIDRYLVNHKSTPSSITFFVLLFVYTLLQREEVQVHHTLERGVGPPGYAIAQSPTPRAPSCSNPAFCPELGSRTPPTICQE